MKATVTLITMGSQSGQPREVKLYAFDDGDRLVVVGSLGGAAHDPAWATNLRAQPMASVRRGKADQGVRAYEAQGEERDRLWTLVSNQFPLYNTYQRRTKRVIPLFVLEPVAGPAQEPDRPG